MSNAGTSALTQVRTEIDRIDRQLVQGIAEREIWVRTAGKLKALTAGEATGEIGASVRDPDRVQQVVAGVRALAAELGADPGVVERTYRAMIEAFIDLELSQQDLPDAQFAPRPTRNLGVRQDDPQIGLRISPLSVADAGELLTLQRAAYASEARIYGDAELPALVQTMPELVAELSNCMGHKVTRGSRMVGAVRSVIDGDTLHIGRLTVAPDAQGLGLGTALLATAEADAGPEVTSAALFTGHLSTANLRLYERHGYVEEREQELKPGVRLVHLRKPLP